MRRTGAILSLLSAAALLVAVTGCLELPDYEEIDKLRVLALRADRPQVVVGETVTMDALVVTPKDEQVSLSWQLCAYVKGADARRACPKKGILKEGTGETFTFTVDAETAAELKPLCEGQGDVVSTLPKGTELPQCKEDGYPLMVRMVAKAGKETLVAVKRVPVLEALPKQRYENPTIVGFDDLPETVREGETVAFSVNVEGPSPPPEETCDDDDNGDDGEHGDDDGDDDGAGADAGVIDAGDLDDAPHSFRYSWFLRGGDPEYLDDKWDEMDDALGDDARDTCYLKVKKGEKRVSVWIVVRDFKYGVDWRRLDFDVE